MWAKNVGQGAEKHDYLKMSPIITDSSIYTSSTSGYITSINKTNGATNWEVNLHSSIISGPGVGGGLIVVGCRNGDVIALLQENGRQVWKKNIPGQVVANPGVSNNIVVVKALDGYTRGLSIKDGHEIWSYQQVEPNLILRGSSSPLISGNNVIAGYANGSLAKFNLNDGELEWQQMIAIPQGAFTIQRMVDVDADPIVFHHKIYAVAYQGRIASLDWESGSILWSRDLSSYTGMVADETSVYVSDTRGLVRSFNTDTGERNWRQDKLQYRIISGPADMDNYVVVGDGQGYLHWLNKTNGHLAGRASLGHAIYASPIADNHVLYALTNSGYLAAYTI